MILQHRPVVNLIEWVNNSFAVSSNDRLLFMTSLCFDLSVYDVFGMLAAGGEIFIARQDHVKDPELLFDLLITRGITFWDSAPAALQQLTHLMPNDCSASKDLRLVFLSGDWIPLTLQPAMTGGFSQREGDWSGRRHRSRHLV